MKIKNKLIELLPPILFIGFIATVEPLAELIVNII